MSNARDFLLSLGLSEDACVNYKPYEYGRLVEHISFSEAVERLEKDIAGCKDFCEGYPQIENVEFFAFRMACDIFKKNIVIY